MHHPHNILPSSLLNQILLGADLLRFQAEDGIRDVERSRGLGDVYKRQVQVWSCPKTPVTVLRYGDPSKGEDPVSYTHLTLPTICSV